MRLPLNLRTALFAAVLSLFVPLRQAQAQECVKFQGLNHCGIGAARVSGSEKDVRIDVPEATGKDGISIQLPSAEAWTAEFVSDDDVHRDLFTAVAEGAPVSTTTMDSKPDATTYSATFTGSGEGTTYSVLAYYNGKLQAAVGGIPSGTQGAASRFIPNGSQPPSCRRLPQTYSQCLEACDNIGYVNCDYCSTPCRTILSFKNDRLTGACSWTVGVNEPAVTLANGKEVLADQLVLLEEVVGPSNYPYLDFNRIDLQTTARSTVITAESFIPASR
jgi:hypothetical protein